MVVLVVLVPESWLVFRGMHQPMQGARLCTSDCATTAALMGIPRGVLAHFGHREFLEQERHTPILCRQPKNNMSQALEKRRHRSINGLPIRSQRSLPHHFLNVEHNHMLKIQILGRHIDRSSTTVVRTKRGLRRNRTLYCTTLTLWWPM